MIERHVTFNVVPEKTTEFEQFFMHEYRPAMSSMAGFVKVGLLRNQDQPSQYCMVICFDSTQNASASFCVSPAARANSFPSRAHSTLRIHPDDD